MVVLPVINRWFVSVEKPKSSRALPGFAREAKTFPTEAEAKQYAKQMISDERSRIIAGTLLGPDQPTRRIISGRQLHHWVAE